MLTGYNTDIHVAGVTYHVQTEDKGLKTPLILSLIYNKGTILGARRTSYQEMITDGKVDEGRLAKAIERQHQIILGAIQGGKLEQLIKKLNETSPPGGHAAAPAKIETTPAKPEEKPPVTVAAPSPIAVRVAPAGLNAATPARPVVKARAGSSPLASRSYNLSDLTADGSSGFDEILDEFLKSDLPREEMTIELASSPRLVAGDEVTVRASVLYDGQWPAVGATVKIMIVGTTITPQILTTRCDHSGSFTATLKLPEFNSGTAAVILQSNDPKGQQAELKLLIRKR